MQTKGSTPSLGGRSTGSCCSCCSSRLSYSNASLEAYNEASKQACWRQQQQEPEAARGSLLVRFMQGLVVIIAFSAHSVFDGVAIGLQESEPRLWTMFFAICSHKLVVALAVGLFPCSKLSHALP